MASKAGKGPLWVAVCGIALVAGLGVYLANSPGRNASSSQTEAATTVHSQEPVKVYTPRYEKDDLKLDETPKKPTPGSDPRVFAVNQYLAQLRMVPRGAVATSCTVQDGVAKLDFTPEFGATYGTEDEQTIVKGLLTTMAQFQEVKSVLFTVAGKPLETLGNIDLTEPQPVIPPEPSSSKPKDAGRPPTSSQ